MSLLLSLLFLATTQDVLTGFEGRLESAFDEETYKRYLYYCRQQNEGERLYENSTKWLVVNPGNDLLLFGRAEGLFMAGSESEAVKQFKELYKNKPERASEIIFTLKELDASDMTWFINQERKRTGNPTLHAELMVDFYIKNNENYKALDEIRGALESGTNASVFKRYIDILAERLGVQKISSQLKSIKGKPDFLTAIETGDTTALLSTIRQISDKNELEKIGKASEQANYLTPALSAYEKAHMDIDAARVLAELGRDEEARRLLEGKGSPPALEMLAGILSRSESTYAEAVEIFTELTRQKGVKANWSVRSAILILLMGNSAEATRMLSGIGEDDQVLFAKALVASAAGDNDTLKRCMDAMLIRHPGSALENDLILVYKVSLTLPQVAGEYALTMAACKWGDAKDAFNRAKRLEGTSTEIADEALLLQAESLIKLHRYEDAEKCYFKLASDFSQSPLALRAIFEKALLQRDKLNKPEEARESFKELIIKAPASLFADLARHEI